MLLDTIKNFYFMKLPLNLRWLEFFRGYELFLGGGGGGVWAAIGNTQYALTNREVYLMTFE